MLAKEPYTAKNFRVLELGDPKASVISASFVKIIP